MSETIEELLEGIEQRREQAACGLSPIPLGAQNLPGAVAHKALYQLVMKDVPALIGKVRSQHEAGVTMAQGATFAVNELGTLNKELKEENESLKKLVASYLATDVADIEKAMIGFLETFDYVVKKKTPLGKKR